jgi:4-diphosphocytidyl-2-C-methyl-D-erythritol kinase
VSVLRTLTVPAPAKLNLFLHVTGRRSDGYHLLESLMVLLDFGDWLTFESRDDGVIESAGQPPGVDPEADLTIRAARMLQRHCKTRLGAKVTLDKRIPIGAGMGGGSSDAASTLLALNRLWGAGMPRAELMRLGLALGADVPFFVNGRNALACGIGEQLVPVSMPRVAFVIAMPPVATPTADIFSAPDLMRSTPRVSSRAFPLDFGHNDLQPVAIRRAPAIATVARALDAVDFAEAGRRAVGAARMTGSGSAVFRIVEPGFPRTPEAWRALADRERAAWKLLQRIVYRAPRTHAPSGAPETGTRLIHASIIPVHPLREFAAK